MKQITLGSTHICVLQNAFGALPIQRVDLQTATQILQRSYDGGMRFYDTARAYSDSEEKIGHALSGVREHIYIATKTQAHTADAFWNDLKTSLRLLQTTYVDIYQFHCADTCFSPNDGSGMYECMQQAKSEGLIRHIGLTTHKLQVARDCIASGLYETLQYPLSYLSSDEEIDLVHQCQKQNMGLIAMKGLAGGLITNARAACAFLTQFDNVLPIWGIQKAEELEEWLSFIQNTPVMDEEISNFIAQDKTELNGEFCRGCGYCMPCPAGILINNCARMSLMLRRAPSAQWLSPTWQANMEKIMDCLHCGQCMKKCPYELNTPALLEKNYEDYQRVLRDEATV